MKYVLGALAIGIALAAAVPGAAFAASGCSVAALKGKYLYAYTGNVVSGADRGPFATSGYDVYDGAGKITGLGTTSNNGKIARRGRYTGTYKISWDCSGTATYDDGSTYDIFATPDGATIVFVQTNYGTISSGSEQRVTTTNR